MINASEPLPPFSNGRHNQNKSIAAYKRVGLVIMTGCMLSPALIHAKGVNAETQNLLKQLEEYKLQLEQTNKRLQELEEREAIRPKGNGNGLNGSYHYGNGKTSDTATAKLRNVQQEPYVEEPLEANVPKSRFLRGFYDGGFSLRTKDIGAGS
jgi:hypothetical protein